MDADKLAGRCWRWRLAVAATAGFTCVCSCSGPAWENNIAGGESPSNLSGLSSTPDPLLGGGEPGTAGGGGSQQAARSTGARLSWQEAHAAIAKKLEQSYRGDRSKALRIAVLDFTTSSGGACALGSPLAEEIGSDLFAAKPFALVERRLLEKILKENAIDHSQLMDPNTTARMGKLAGVGGIVTGTITVSDREFGVHARLIDTETGTVLALAAVVIDRTDAERIAKCEGGGTPATGQQSSTSATVPSPGATRTNGSSLFFEDFSTVTEGAVPSGWVGGDQMVVRTTGRGKALFLAATGRSQDSVSTAPIHFPENFRLEVVATIENSCWGSIQVSIGALQFLNRCCVLALPPDEVNECNIGKNASFLLERQDGVVTLAVNGKRHFLRRWPNLKLDGRLRIDLRQDNQAGVTVHRIALTAM